MCPHGMKTMSASLSKQTLKEEGVIKTAWSWNIVDMQIRVKGYKNTQGKIWWATATTKFTLNVLFRAPLQTMEQSEFSAFWVLFRKNRWTLHPHSLRLSPPIRGYELSLSRFVSFHTLMVFSFTLPCKTTPLCVFYWCHPNPKHMLSFLNTSTSGWASNRTTWRINSHKSFSCQKRKKRMFCN